MSVQLWNFKDGGSYPKIGHRFWTFPNKDFFFRFFYPKFQATVEETFGCKRKKMLIVSDD